MLKPSDQAVTPPRLPFQESDREGDRDCEPEPAQEPRSSDQMSMEMDMSTTPPPEPPSRQLFYCYSTLAIIISFLVCNEYFFV
jgi:hypothetical protein